MISGNDMYIFSAILAQLFRQPMHLPTDVASLLWALPICLSIALVYKALKMKTITPYLFIREVILLFATLIGFLVAGALALVVIAYIARL